MLNFRGVHTKPLGQLGKKSVSLQWKQALALHATVRPDRESKGLAHVLEAVTVETTQIRQGPAVFGLRIGQVEGSDAERLGESLDPRSFGSALAGLVEEDLLLRCSGTGRQCGNAQLDR